MVSKASPIVVNNDELEQKLIDETSTGIGQTLNDADGIATDAVTSAEFSTLMNSLTSLESEIGNLQTRINDAASQTDQDFANDVMNGVDINMKRYCLNRAITQLQIGYNRINNIGADDSAPDGVAIDKASKPTYLRILNPVSYKEMGRYFLPACSFFNTYAYTAKYTYSSDSTLGPRPLYPGVRFKYSVKISSDNLIILSYYTDSDVTEYFTTAIEASLPETPTMGVCIFDIDENSNILNLISDTNNVDDDYSVYEGSNPGCFTSQSFFDVNSLILENGTVIFENRTQCLIVKHDSNDGSISLESKTLDAVTENADASPAVMKILKLENDPVTPANFFALYGPANAGDATDLVYKEYSTIDSTNMTYPYFVPHSAVKSRVGSMSYADYVSLYSMRVCGRYIVMSHCSRLESDITNAGIDDSSIMSSFVIDRNTMTTNRFDKLNSQADRSGTIKVAPMRVTSAYVSDNGDLYFALKYEFIKSNVEPEVHETRRAGLTDRDPGYFRIVKMADLDNQTTIDGTIYEFNYRNNYAIDGDESLIIGLGWRVYDHESISKFTLRPDSGVVGSTLRNGSNVQPLGFMDMGDEIHYALRTGLSNFNLGEYVGILKFNKLSTNSVVIDNPYIGNPSTIDERKFNVIAEKIADGVGNLGSKDPRYTTLSSLEVSKV